MRYPELSIYNRAICQLLRTVYSYLAETERVDPYLQVTNSCLLEDKVELGPYEDYQPGPWRADYLQFLQIFCSAEKRTFPGVAGLSIRILDSSILSLN